MKQKRFGQKVMNWHRPLQKDQPRRRFQQRHANEGRRQLAAYKVLSDEWSWDEPWEDMYWDYWNIASDMDYAIHAAHTLLEPINHTALQALLRPEHAWRVDAQTEHAATALYTAVAALQRDEFVTRLAAHLQQLATPRPGEGWLPQSTKQALQDQGDRVTLARLLESYGADSEPEAEGTIIHLIMFAPFWIRPLRTWVPQGEDSRSRLLSLVTHLFARYPVPQMLYLEWLTAPERSRMKWLCWFVLLGHGCSLHQAAATFGWQIARKFYQYFAAAPQSMQPTEAAIYAEIMRLGGSTVEFRRMIAHPAYVIDPTAISDQRGHLPFWQDTVLWLSRHRAALTDQQAALVLHWAMHQYTERARGGDTPFTLRGVGRQRAIEESNAYQAQIDRPYWNYQWQGHGWDWEYAETEQSRWTFTELTNGEELYHEGRALHHCVGSYAPRSAAGHSAIVSLRHDDLRRITIELNPRTKNIVQARGAYNREATVVELAIIQRWLATRVRQTLAPAAEGAERS
jgi:hypothetical protein